MKKLDNFKKEILSCKDICKNFDNVHALKGVNFKISSGKVHGLVGENGAGKSTLIKIISGVYSQDSGDIFLQNKKIHISNPEEIIGKGIATIYQDINLIETMTVEENIFLNNEITYKIGGFINNQKIRNTVISLFKEYDLDINPGTLVKELPNDLKKMVQIIKAASRDSKIMLMDEPTSSLDKFEKVKVLELIRHLAQKGIGVVFISHYLNEIFEVCDDITILRDGMVVDTVETAKTNLNKVITMMIGREIKKDFIEKNKTVKKEDILLIRGLGVKNKLNNISLSLKKGEVLGITGIIGAGCNELAKALFGSTDIRKDRGEFIINDKIVNISHPEDAIRNGIAYITNDRVEEGLLQGRPLYENICISALPQFKNRMQLLDERKMIEKSNIYINLLKIKSPNSLVTPQVLSGGNQQKVLIAKGLEIKPIIFIMNEPTIGIDIGTKYEIRKLIKKMAAEGVSIILVTTELEELEELCNRVLIMFRGEIIEELEGDRIDKKQILEASTAGGKK